MRISEKRDWDREAITGQPLTKPLPHRGEALGTPDFSDGTDEERRGDIEDRRHRANRDANSVIATRTLAII
jgi:hypothetical protein